MNEGGGGREENLKYQEWKIRLRFQVSNDRMSSVECTKWYACMHTYRMCLATVVERRCINSPIPINWIGFLCADVFFFSIALSSFESNVREMVKRAQVEINALDSLKTVRRYYLV